jgi:hypothetical protein
MTCRYNNHIKFRPYITSRCTEVLVENLRIEEVLLRVTMTSHVLEKTLLCVKGLSVLKPPKILMLLHVYVCMHVLFSGILSNT